MRETSLVEDLRTTRALDASDFAGIGAPALALYGEHSDIIRESTPLLRAMPRCRLDVLPACTHSVLWEATNDVRARTVAFCRRLEGGGAS